MKNSSTRGTVLVIDDEEIIFDTLQVHLQDQHDLLHAADSIDGLFKARSIMPDLILLDIGLPDINGHDLCRMFKADPAVTNIPIIFLTASSTPEDEARGFEAGAVDYIAKPVNPVTVKARVATHMELKLRQDQADALVRLDGLTHITNRPGFDEILAREWRRSIRAKVPLSLVMMDIDAFQLYNDMYGHMAGDECLRSVVGCLKASAQRGGDTLARYGGEEFAAILYDTPFESIGMLAERFRSAVAGAGIPHAGSDVADIVTISTGAATMLPVQGQSVDILVATADQALYEAKKNGGNGVCTRQVSDTGEVTAIHVVPPEPAIASG